MNPQKTNQADTRQLEKWRSDAAEDEVPSRSLSLSLSFCPSLFLFFCPSLCLLLSLAHSPALSRSLALTLSPAKHTVRNADHPELPCKSMQVYLQVSNGRQIAHSTAAKAMGEEELHRRMLHTHTYT